MKSVVSLFVVVVVSFFFVSSVLAVSNSEIPGGIASLSPSGNLIYYCFATGEKIIIAQGIGNCPFAVAENGTAIWVTNGKIWIKQWDKEPQTLKREKISEAKVGEIFAAAAKPGKKVAVGSKDLSKMDFLAPAIGAISISSDGTKFSYVTVQAGHSWKMAPGLNQEWNMNYGHLNEKYPTWQMLIREQDSFYQVEGFGLSISEEGPLLKNNLSWYTKCGNAGLYPPVFPYKHRPQDRPIPPMAHPVCSGVSSVPYHQYGGLTLNVKDTQERYSLRRSVAFMAWSPIMEGKEETFVSTNSVKNPRMGPYDQVMNKFLFAVIYQCMDASGSSWYGPIEIHDENQAHPTNFFVGKRTGIYEIPIRIPYCQGLAIGKNGIFVISDSKVALFPMEDILNGIANSSVVKIQGGALYNGVRGRSDPPAYTPKNNIFNIQPTVVTENLDGDNIKWMGEMFLYRNKAGQLCLWEDGNARIVFNAVIPEKYFWVNLLSPKAETGVPLVSSGG